MHWKCITFQSTILFFMFTRQLMDIESLCPSPMSKQTPSKQQNGEQTSDIELFDSTSEDFYDRPSNDEMAAGFTKLYPRNNYNESLAFKEVMLHLKFKNLESKIAVNLLNCQIQKHDSGVSKEVIVLNFEEFKDLTEASFRDRFLSLPNPIARIQIYLSVARVLKALHASKTVHCRIMPSSLGFVGDTYSSIILRDFIYATDLNSDKLEVCQKIKNTAVAKDIGHPTCRTKKKIYKTDIWAFGLIILQIESMKGLISDSFFISDPSVVKMNCYTLEWTDKCQDYLQKLVLKTFDDAKNKTPQHSKTFTQLQNIVLDLFKDCEDRPTAVKLVEQLGDLITDKNSFRNKKSKPIQNPHKKKRSGIFDGIFECFGTPCDMQPLYADWRLDFHFI
jgi:hypothetical protein